MSIRRQRYRILKGQHGKQDQATGKYKKTVVQIAPEDQQHQIIVEDCSNIIIRGASVLGWSESGDVMKGKRYGIDIRGGCDSLGLESPKIKGNPDEFNEKHWRESACNGLIVREENTNINITKPEIDGVHFGLDLRGDIGSVIGGRVNKVSADNLCGRGNAWTIDNLSLYESLEVVSYDEVHRDLIQLFNNGGIISDWLIQNCYLGRANLEHIFEKFSQIFLLSDGEGLRNKFINNKIITGHDLVAVMNPSSDSEISGNRIWTMEDTKPQVRIIEERNGCRSSCNIVENNPIKPIGDLTSFDLNLDAFSEEELIGIGHLMEGEPVEVKPLDTDTPLVKTEREGFVYSSDEEGRKPYEMTLQGISTLELSEGSRKNVYYCTAHKATIGVGHALTDDEFKTGRIVLDNGRILEYKKGLNKEEIYALLASDLSRFNKAVADYVKVGLTSYQFDALVHFSFNVGVGAFKKSTLLKKLNTGLYDEVPFEIRRWIRQPELKGRREIECSLWEGSYKANKDQSKGFFNKGIKGKLKQALKSRTVKAVLAGSGTLGAAALETATSSIGEIVKSPVEAIEKAKNTIDGVSLDLEQITDKTGVIASLLGFDSTNYIHFVKYGVLATVSIVFISFLIIGYARFDDMNTGKNP